MVAGMLMAIGFLFLGSRDRGRPAFNEEDPARAEKESLRMPCPSGGGYYET